jgi:flagellar protein FliJ
MRNFRFRLDPVIRLKEYQIERKEEEIASIQANIQQRINEIEEGRRSVMEMRRRVMDETPDHNLIQAERSLDLFQNFMREQETLKRQEIEELEKKKTLKRQELIKLYQDEKILDRYKEKKKTEWEKEMQREDNIQLDELGTQNFLRRKSQRGGAMLYLILPLFIGAAAIAIGLYTGIVPEKYKEKIPFLKTSPSSATGEISAAGQVASPTREQSEYLTLRELIGDIDDPMPVILQNIAKEREDLNTLRLQLDEQKIMIGQREAQLAQQEQRIGELIQQASNQITVLRNLEALREERIKSEASKRELDLAMAMAKNKKSKDIPQLIINLFEAADETEEDKKEDSKMLALRILHHYEAKDLESLFAVMAKANPGSTAQIIKAYAETSMDELYGITEEDAQPQPIPEPENNTETAGAL